VAGDFRWSITASSASRTSSMNEALDPSSIDIRPSSAMYPVTNSPASSTISPACSTSTPIRRRVALKRMAWAASRLMIIAAAIVSPPGIATRKPASSTGRNSPGSTIATQERK